MKTLSKEQVLNLHNALLEAFGGTAGFRDDGLLESALNVPFTTFGGQYLYPSVQAKAAQLGFGLVCNHPLVDGNKRNGKLSGKAKISRSWQKTSYRKIENILKTTEKIENFLEKG